MPNIMVVVGCGVGGSESVRDRRVEVWCSVRQGEKGTSRVAALPTTPFIYPNPGIYWATAVKKQRQRDLMRPCVGIQNNRPMCRAWRGEAEANKAKQQHAHFPHSDQFRSAGTMGPWSLTTLSDPRCGWITPFPPIPSCRRGHSTTRLPSPVPSVLTAQLLWPFRFNIR